MKSFKKGKIKFRYLKYKNKRIYLGYCEHCKLNRYASYIDGCIIIVLNKKISEKVRSNTLHKIIKLVSSKKNINKSLVNYIKELDMF